MSAERLRTIQRHLTSNQRTGLHTHLSSYYEEPKLRYTLENCPLTYEERQFYEENGFIIIPGLIEDELIDECGQRFLDLCEGRLPKGNLTLMKDISLMKTNATGENLYFKAQDILFDEVFERYCKHGKLLDYVEGFVGPNIKGMHSMLINKPPDSGAKTSRHPLHQDLYYFPFRPADRIVAAWTAMEKVNLENGCLVGIPGSHHRHPGGCLLQHDYPNWENGVNKAFHGIKGCDDYETVPFIMEKGDTIFFHPLLIHGSGANFSKGFRKAISCHYASSDCVYIDVKGTLQENISKEIEEMALKKGLVLDITDVWRYKSLLVRGNEGTL